MGGSVNLAIVSELQPFLLFVAAVFALAGFVKGVVGLGLPTVSMGLLAVTMAPSQALAIVIVPAVVTTSGRPFSAITCATSSAGCGRSSSAPPSASG